MPSASPSHPAACALERGRASDAPAWASSALAAPARNVSLRRELTLVLTGVGMRIASAGCGLLAGCGLPPGDARARWPDDAPTTQQWIERRLALGALRDAHTPERGYTMRLALELREPVSGQRLRARGAVAVDPEARAFRMVLLGPGGTTALDLWSCGDEFRFELPAIGLTRRGDGASEPELARGLPVGFLRWWLLEPFAGRLLYAAGLEGTDRYVLERHGAYLDVRRHADGRLELERRSDGDLERVVSSGAGCAIAHYWQWSTGLDIRVSCEHIDVERLPAAAALADPDEPARACLPVRGNIR